MAHTSHLEMMKNPDLWPLWPLLPLKNRGAPGKTAFLLSTSLEGRMEGEVIVYLGNIYQPDKALQDPEAAVPYNNLEAVISDGWTVD